MFAERVEGKFSPYNIVYVCMYVYACVCECGS